jgi:hypothetical protein
MGYSLTYVFVMRHTSIPVAFLTLSLMFLIPVGAAPSLQAGSSATYNVSIVISLLPPPCNTSTISGSQPSIIYCPVDDGNLPSVEINGTIGWTTTKVNDTTAMLNVTHSLATFLSNNLTMPLFKNTGSFNESINLANRTINIMPLIMPEMEQALQGLPSTSSLTSQVDTISSVMWTRPSVHTMWWVNGPLNLNETVPVLVFPTNVTSSASLTLGNIGTRTAWTLTFNLSQPSPEQTATNAYPIPVGDNLLASFSFNYDQQSDLLLSAAANIHLGFPMPIPYQPNPCTSSGTTVCPASSAYATFVQSGVNIQATFTLSKTDLNLNQRSGSTGGNGPDSSSGPSGPSGGPGPGGTSTGPGPGTSPGPGTAGAGSGPTGGTNPGGAPQSTATKPAGIPWIYWILAMVAVGVIVTGIFLARRRA